MVFKNTLPFAQALDAEDVLKEFRQAFIIPSHKNKEAIYFLGNSLGLQPTQTHQYIEEVLKQWASYGVEGFFKGQLPWLQYQEQVAQMLAPVVGALPHEVVIMNQLTVNLHLMFVSFYQPNEQRRKIICEAKAFPSDQYMLDSHVKQRGFIPDDVLIEIQPRPGENSIHQDDIMAAIEQHKNELALVFWGGVNYYTGQVFDMEAIAKAAHNAGALVGFDLAHAAGNIALQLHEWNVDFACWCNYKYLNSGPGAVGGVYVHERYHKDDSLHRFAGWWGYKKETQFLMRKEFTPEVSAEGWQLSTPSPILFAACKASFEIFKKAGVEKIFAKNKLLNEYLWFLLGEISKELPPVSFSIITPPGSHEKGCQVSLQVKNGKQVFTSLTDEGVFADWREPDVIRVAPVGLYNTFAEVWKFVQFLKSAIIKFSS